ncbi:hypothetical protein JCM14469_05190 [Desulfatiferula olefinivorans]
MFDIISKHDYFDWIDHGHCVTKNTSIKKVQDAFVLSVLSQEKGKKIAEIGGGQSRILELLSENNECWNIDPLEGSGHGPRDVDCGPNIKLIRANMGDFSREIPTDFFDYVFSISVVEHVPLDVVNDFFSDATRILKKGGLSIHAIDLYVGDHVNVRTNPQVDLYRSLDLRQGLGLAFLEPPVVDAQAVFCTHYASNSDDAIYSWNKIYPGSINRIRTSCQSVSIKAIWRRTA